MFYLPLLFLLAAELPTTHPLDRGAVTNAMRKALASNPDYRDANIEILDLSRFPFPDGQVEFDWKGLTPPGAEQSTERWRGLLRQDVNHSFSIWAVVRITTPCTRVLATQTIRPDEPIGTSELREESYDGFPSDGCKDRAANVIGKVATRTILQNTPIARTMLALPASVLKGETAVAEYHNDAVRLSLSVIAERSGRIGEVIRVLNPDTHKTFFAQVTGEGKVLIESGSRPQSLTPSLPIGDQQ
jgi:flagella basal body P-ring formation protein FlgA